MQAEAAELLRAMIDRTVLTPADDGLRAELCGDLAAVLAVCGEAAAPKREQPDARASGCQLSVVAGAGYHLCRTIVIWPR